MNWCRECRSDDIVTDYTAGDVICRNCGVVLAEKIIDDSPEWTCYANDEGGSRDDPSRVGDAANPLDDGIGVRTCIQGGDADHAQMLRKVQQAVGGGCSQHDKSMMAVYARVRQIADVLAVPHHVTESACMHLKKLDEEKLFHRKNGPAADPMIAAVLYTVCKQGHAHRSQEEVVAAANVAKRDMTRCFKKIHTTAIFQSSVNLKPVDLVSRYTGQLGLNGSVSMIGKHMAETAYQMKLTSGQVPQAVALACLLLACMAGAQPDRKLAMQELTQFASETNIQVAYTALRPSLAQLMPVHFLDRHPRQRASLEQLPLII